MDPREDTNFVWNQEHPTVIEVRAVEQLAGFKVRLRFSNGEKRELDLKPYLHGPIFEPLRKDRALFSRMRVQWGTLCWPNGADIAPETLYEDGRVVEEASSRNSNASARKRSTNKLKVTSPRTALRRKIVKEKRHARPRRG